MKYEIDEGDRQLILLAIAELALSRPGWDWTLGRLAELLSTSPAVADGRVMFEQFKSANADRVKESHTPRDLRWLNRPDEESTR
jgi:hypothetical protein